jgi:hypothetical protein
MIVVRVMARIARTKEAHPSKRPLQSARMVICSIAWGALAEPKKLATERPKGTDSLRTARLTGLGTGAVQRPKRETVTSI